MLGNQKKNKDHRYHKIHAETKVEMGQSYSKTQSGSQGEGRGREDDQAEDGKMTWQRRREPPGLGKQQTDNDGRHWWRATSCSGWTKPRWRWWRWISAVYRLQLFCLVGYFSQARSRAFFFFFFFYWALLVRLGTAFGLVFWTLVLFVGG